MQTTSCVVYILNLVDTISGKIRALHMNSGHLEHLDLHDVNNKYGDTLKS